MLLAIINLRLKLVDWVVIWCLVTIPVGSLWLWAEIQSLRDRHRARRRQESRPGYMDLRRPR